MRRIHTRPNRLLTISSLFLLLPFAAAGAPMPAPDMAPATNPTQFTPEFMGMHTLSPGKHWPTVPFGSIRPTGTSWGALEPARGQYDWHSLDTWVSQAQSHHVQFDYLFLNTPQWASTRPNEACNRGPVGCAAPPNPQAWEEFVTALVTRYKGKINSYELWNEPNVIGYWTGSHQQMVDMASRAYKIIKSIDPQALVVSPSASSTGWPLQHDAWVDQYLAAGGGKYADVIGWHGYSGRNDRAALPPEDMARQITALRAVLAKYNLANLPIWNTEGSWGKDAQLPDEGQQAAFLVKWYMIQFTNGVSRAYWYQWDSDWGTLWREGSGLTQAGEAYKQVHDWLQDVTASSPCKAQGALWTCDLVKGNVPYRVAWSASGNSAYPDSAKFASSTALGSTSETPEGSPTTVSSRPILFRIK